MAANVENMFYVRETPWHGQGVRVLDAPTSADAIRLAGLDWTVNPQPIFLADGTEIKGTVANVRSSDGKPLGVVGGRYQVVQNTDAFSFTDQLLGEGVKYETAGSLRGGRVIWLLARFPETMEILGDEVEPYMVFTNTHDGSGAVRVAMTPIRVVCNNTLNAAMNGAKRTWSARHTGSIETKLDEARMTLQLAKKYMEATKETFEDLYKVKLTDKKTEDLIEQIIPFPSKVTDRQKRNLEQVREDIKYRYFNAPDLKILDKTGARLIQAVADTTSHILPFRQTKDYKENKFQAMIAGNDTLDLAVKIALAA